MKIDYRDYFGFRYTHLGRYYFWSFVMDFVGGYFSPHMRLYMFARVRRNKAKEEKPEIIHDVIG